MNALRKVFKCGSCDRQFAYACLLRDHNNLHTGEKPHLCSMCGKRFSLKGSLKQHSRSHLPYKHKCKYCSFKANVRSDLEKHERTHTGERPYMCHICGEGYIQSSHLSDHSKTHTNERPNKCDLCGRGFLKKSDMLRHRRIHTGEFPYHCHECGKSFRQSTQFSNHVKNRHPEVANSEDRTPMLSQTIHHESLLNEDLLISSQPTDLLTTNIRSSEIEFNDQLDITSSTAFLESEVTPFLQRI